VDALHHFGPPHYGLIGDGFALLQLVACASPDLRDRAMRLGLDDMCEQLLESTAEAVPDALRATTRQLLDRLRDDVWWEEETMRVTLAGARRGCAGIGLPGAPGKRVSVMAGSSSMSDVDGDSKTPFWKRLAVRAMPSMRASMRLLAAVRRPSDDGLGRQNWLTAQQGADANWLPPLQPSSSRVSSAFCDPVREELSLPALGQNARRRSVGQPSPERARLWFNAAALHRISGKRLLAVHVPLSASLTDDRHLPDGHSHHASGPLRSFGSVGQIGGVQPAAPPAPLAVASAVYGKRQSSPLRALRPPPLRVDGGNKGDSRRGGSLENGPHTH
jgi:hypothetical protein